MTVLVVSMPERGHVQRLLPIVAGLSRRTTVHVMTHARFAPEVERAGGRFFDLFGAFPIEAADGTSIPVPSRYVTFAAAYAEQVIAEAAKLRPSLVVYDTFAVIAPIVARRLGVPWINACANHAAIPSETLAYLAVDPRVKTSEACLRAVERLRSEHGLATASPFSFVDQLSPYLNLYCEPPEMLDERERAAFEPIAFIGSLDPEAHAIGPSLFGAGRRRIYVSFGTVIWRYFVADARAALECLSRTLGAMPGVEVLISLGGHPLDAALAREGVRVEPYVDQWSVLASADLFITHHGLNSTHESIFHQVPMLSYPFFGDQPAMARRCAELGLALPLSDAPRAPLDEVAVRDRVTAALEAAPRFAERLAVARSWELRTIAERPAVLERMCAIAERGA